MPPKTAKFVLALLATSALGIAGFDFGANLLSTAHLAHFVAAHPGLKVARMETNLLANNVTLYGVETVAGSMKVSIGALRFPVARSRFEMIESAAASPFDDAPPAAAGGGTASADNVVITSGTTTFRIKRIDLAGTSLTNDDLAAILDSKRAESLADRLKKLTAASIVIPELTADDVTPDHESHWTERQILLANVTAGRVAAGSAAGMSITTKDAKDATNGTLGAIDTAGLDLGQFVRIFTTKRTDDNEPQVPLLDSLTINGGQFTNVTKSASFSFGTIKQTGVKARALMINPAEVKSDDTETSKRLSDDLFRSLTVGNLSVANFAVQDNTSGDKFTLASIAISDFGSGKVGGVKAADFAYHGASAKVAIGSMDIGAFTIPKSDADNDTMAPTVGQTDFRDIAVDATSPSSDPAQPATPFKFGIKHIGFAEDSDKGAPRHGSLSVDNVTFDVPPGSTAQPLLDIGYAHLDISSKAASTYDGTAQTLSIRDVSLSGVDMGTISLGLDLGNVGPAIFSSNTSAQKVAALAVLLKGVDLKLENTGLIDKAIAWRAKADGVTPAQETEKAAALATGQIPAMLGNGANAKTIATAVATFITAPKTLHIQASSKTGLGVADAALMNTPDVLLDSLDVKASANQ